VVKTLLPARTRGMAATTVLFAASWLAACTDGPVPTLPQAYTGFPAAVDPQCRDGSATIYDECGDQLALFRTALARANAENKVLLVEYGAEWCIWCHVFNAYINGDKGRFRYTYASAKEPEAWATRTFEEDDDVEGAEELRDSSRATSSSSVSTLSTRPTERTCWSRPERKSTSPEAYRSCSPSIRTDVTRRPSKAAGSKNAAARSTGIAASIAMPCFAC